MNAHCVNCGWNGEPHDLLGGRYCPVCGPPSWPDVGAACPACAEMRMPDDPAPADDRCARCPPTLEPAVEEVA